MDIKNVIEQIIVASPGVSLHTSPNLTLGCFPTEHQSCNAFDSIADYLHENGIWKIYKEVTGHYISSFPFEKSLDCRIDRVVVPGPVMVESGWLFGPIGIEIKRSGEKLGKPASQCLDYRNAVFSIDNHHVLLRQVFLWPLETWGGGELESVMAQKRIGGCINNYRHESIDFYLGQQLVLSVCKNGTIRELKSVFIDRLGRKKGSR